MKVGFNDSRNYWIGNDRLNNLTSTGYLKLRINMWQNWTYYTAEYSTVSVGNESTGYVLHQGGYSGTAGNSLYYNEGWKFSTYDQDSSGNCPSSRYGSWWYAQGTMAGMNNKIGMAEGFTWLPNNAGTLSLTQMCLV